ncbi:MAG: hypothetical protein E7058_09360 [Lentisphaerae bacterium]|nr:hypothetical protein [Lentisphaerota bacterium]
MKKISWLSCLVLLSLLLHGSENLILNGKFVRGSSKYPRLWAFYNNNMTGDAEYMTSGGPDGKNFIRLIKNFTLRQKGVTLAVGGKYKLSGWVRSTKADPQKCGVYFARKMLFPFPADQPEWKHFVYEFVFQSGKKKNGDRVESVLKVGGECQQLDLADLKLEPLNEIAKTKSADCFQSMKADLVPGFVLRYIPFSKQEVDFYWLGPAPCKPADMRCTVRSKKNGKVYHPRFSDNLLRFDLGNLPVGEDILEIELFSGGQTSFYQRHYPIRIVRSPALPAGSRKLNNLVTELPPVKLRPGKTGTVVNPRYGWLYFRFQSDDKNAELTLAGENLLSPAYPDMECFRLLEPGTYTVAAVKGEGTLTVRLIPEISFFPIQKCPIGGENPDQTFISKHMAGTITTFNCGTGKMAEMQQQKHIVLTNFSISQLRKAGVEYMLSKLNAPESRLNLPDQHGATLDEMDYAFERRTFDDYATLFQQYKNPENKLLYTYTCGPVPDAYKAFFSAAVNLSGGRGRILHESYEKSRPTTADAENSVRQMVGHISIYRDTMPKTWDRISAVFDLSSEPPFRSMANYPEQDFKYYLDMLLNAAAVDPACDGLGGIGYWGAHRASGETMRWALRLIRHYAIEGKTEMLSAQYGYKFIPGHLVNPDFTDGLTGWKHNSAVAAGKNKWYGKIQRSRGLAGAGNTFALLDCRAAVKPRLSQTLKNLTPGKAYTLSCMYADRNAVTKRNFQRRKIKLDIEISDAKILQDSNFIPLAKQKISICINRRYMVFIPDKPEVTVTFSADNEKEVPQIALNYIAVNPFFSDGK